MKRLLLIFGMLVAVGGFLGIKARAAETDMLQRVIEVPGATKEKIFDKVRTWSERYAQSISSDPKSGVIVAKGEISYPSPTVDRVQYTILFNMKNTIQNNKVAVAFEDVMLKAPKSYLVESVGVSQPFTGGEVVPVKSKKDKMAADNILNYVTDNLGDTLLNKTETASTLERCKECGSLTTTPAEMEEQMKGHSDQKPSPKE
jgi:hypothetical protein